MSDLLIGRENVYVCPECNGYTVTIDVDAGVTPFLLKCRAKGDGMCTGMAVSSCYPKGPRPTNMPAPAWEWYKPKGMDYQKLSSEMKRHVDKGGLYIRARAAPAATDEEKWLMKALEMIAAERKRQIDCKGYTPQHDDEHSNGELAMAAIAYASPLDIDADSNEPNAVVVTDQEGDLESVYPFADRPQSLFCGDRRSLPTQARIRQLAIAGALIVAEMERLQRVPAPAAKEKNNDR